MDQSFINFSFCNGSYKESFREFKKKEEKTCHLGGKACHHKALTMKKIL